MEKCRREYARIAVSWPVSIFTTSGSIDGEIKNISIGGALINCQRLPDLEQTFNLTIEIPDYLFPVAARVKKVRLNVYDSESDRSPPSYDLAVRFMDMSAEDGKIIHEAIDRAFRMQQHKPAPKKVRHKTRSRLDGSLLMSVEKLSSELGKPFKDLLEEALQDLIYKYEKLSSEKDQRLHL